MQLSTTVDHANNEVLVYQDTTGVVRGQIHIATKSKHKIKQVLIRLVRDELVDMADAEPTSPSAAAVAASSSGLLPILQKTSKIISTWVVLPERKDSHILAEGSHTYSFEISLPAGLDGSIDTVAYKLMYFLEARVKYPSILKPNDAVRTPITLIQVPMTTNLHSDDSISLSLSPIPISSPLESLGPYDVPVGHSLRLHADLIDQGSEFSLRHLWENKLAFRITLPKGRALAAGTSPVVEVETLPIVRDFRFSKVTLTLEEITIMARPQKGQVQPQGTISINDYQHSVNSNRTEARTSSGSTRRRDRRSSTAANTASTSTATHSINRHSTANRSVMSHSSTSSDDGNRSVHSISSHTSQNHALALVRDSSSEYSSAVSKVRELSKTTLALPSSSLGTLSSHTVRFTNTADHGFLTARTRIRVPPLSLGDTHTDTRNSHIQVHHQLLYELEFRKIDSGADSYMPLNSDQLLAMGLSTSATGGIAANIHPRIRAIADMYKDLGKPNILRRDELPDPSNLPLSEELLAKPRVVRGMLPVSIIPAQLAQMWNVGQPVSQSEIESELNIPMPVQDEPTEHALNRLSISELPAPSASLDNGSSSRTPPHPLASGVGVQSGPSAAVEREKTAGTTQLTQLPRQEVSPSSPATTANGDCGGEIAASQTAGLAHRLPPSAAPTTHSAQPSQVELYRSATLGTMASGESTMSTGTAAETLAPTSAGADMAGASATRMAPVHAAPQIRVESSSSLSPSASYSVPMSMPTPPVSFPSHSAAAFPLGGFMSAPAMFPGMMPAAFPSLPSSSLAPPQPPQQQQQAPTSSGASFQPAYNPMFSPNLLPLPPSTPANTAASGMAYNPLLFQQQIMMFQEQQRIQQQMFFQQLSEQYAQMLQQQMQASHATASQDNAGGASLTSRPLSSTSTNRAATNDAAAAQQPPPSPMTSVPAPAVPTGAAAASGVNGGAEPAQDASPVPALHINPIPLPGLSAATFTGMAASSPHDESHGLRRPSEPIMHHAHTALHHAASVNAIEAGSAPIPSPRPTASMFTIPPETPVLPTGASSHATPVGALHSATPANASGSFVANGRRATVTAATQQRASSLIDEPTDYSSPPPMYEEISPLVFQPPPYERRL